MAKTRTKGRFSLRMRGDIGKHPARPLPKPVLRRVEQVRIEVTVMLVCGHKLVSFTAVPDLSRLQQPRGCRKCGEERLKKRRKHQKERR